MTQTRSRTQQASAGAAPPLPHLHELAPPGKIDFTTLSSQLRVIGASPAWTIVQEALARLRSVAGRQERYPSYEADVRCIHDFADLLRRNCTTIADALVAGAVIGRAVEGISEGERTLLGLDTIARAYRFAERTETAVGEALRALALQIEARFQGLLKDVELFPRPPFDTSVASWKDAVHAALQAVGSVAVTFDDEAMQTIWKRWQVRAYQFLGGLTLSLPDLGELLAVAADLRPIRLLHLNLQEMTIGDWSTALVAALAPTAPEDPSYCPLWVAGVALYALGFRWQSTADLTDLLAQATSVPKRNEQVPPMRSFAVQRSPSRALLLVKASDPSLTDRWLPSAQIAAITLTWDELQAGIDAFRQQSWTSLPISPRITWLCFEPSGMPDSEVKRRVDQVKSGWPSLFSQARQGPPSTVFLYPEAPQGTPLTPYVIAPRNLDDLVAQLPPAGARTAKPAGAPKPKPSRPPGPA